MEEALPRPGLRGISLNPSLPAGPRLRGRRWGRTGGHGCEPQAPFHGTPRDTGAQSRRSGEGAARDPSCCHGATARELLLVCPQQTQRMTSARGAQMPLPGSCRATTELGPAPRGPARGCAGGPCQGPGQDRRCGPALPRSQSRAGLTGSGQTERERPPAAQECTALISGSVRAWGGNSSPEFAFLSLLLTPALPWVEPRSPGSQVNQVAGTSK